MLLKKILLIAFLSLHIASLKLSVYYYGPQSPTNDVNSNASAVIVAFATINSDGTISLPSPIPCAQIATWKSLGMKVLFSIGGQGANWSSIFASNTSMNNSISSIAQLIQTSPFQGVDLDYQQYAVSPFIMGNWIKSLKSSLNGAYVVITPQCVGVYQGQPVPTQSTWTARDYWNYWVPVLNIAGDSIDAVQVQAYNNWYDNLQAGSLQYLQDVVLQWQNKPSPYCSGCTILNGFSGVPSAKLIIGIPASTTAGNGYPAPSVIQSFIQWTVSQNNAIKGMMIWDSHWDSLNNYLASNAIIQESVPSPINPNPVTIPNVCNTSAPSYQPLQTPSSAKVPISNHPRPTLKDK